MKHTRTPLALVAALGLALTGQVVLPTVTQGATLKTMAGLTSLDTPGLYDLSTAIQGTVGVTVSGVAVTGTAPALTLQPGNNVTLTLVNANITGRDSSGAAIDTTKCTTGCELKLLGANTTDARSLSQGPAVWVPYRTALTITGPGSLSATAFMSGAGIGSSSTDTSGSITIRHATVVAQGGIGSIAGSPAGIGGGATRTNGRIEIVNSSVTATGGNASGSSRNGGGAGIGGGAVGYVNYAASPIIITDSVVVATGGNGSGSGGGGAGIGGGGLYSNTLAPAPVTIDATSVVKAIGGTGSSQTPDGGGGGAAIGGGGGWPATAGSAASSIDLVSGTLAAGSNGGSGGLGATVSGGKGALCGSGGSGGSGGTVPGADGVEATLVSGGTCAEGTAVADLSSRPDPNYPGYPAAPGFTEPVPASTSARDDASFTVAPHSGVDTFQWQESVDGGTTWDDVVDDGDIYWGATTDTLTLTGVPLSMNGYLYRCVVNYLLLPDATSDEVPLTVNAIPVTFTANPVDGVSGTVSTTKLQLEFSKQVTGLTAGDITLIDGTGQATKGSLTSNSGGTLDSVWYLELTSVDVEGDIQVAIASFGDFTVTSSPQLVDVFKAIGYTVTVNQAVGGVVTATPLDAIAGQTVTLQAAAARPYRFIGWQVLPAVTWVSGGDTTMTASFAMPTSNVTVTPVFLLTFVNPPPGPNNQVPNPDVIPWPDVVPPPPPGSSGLAGGFLAYTGDNQSSTTAGLALLASLMGIFALTLRRKHQPARSGPRHALPVG